MSPFARPVRRRALLAGLLVLPAVTLVAAAPLLWLVIVDPFGGGPHPSDHAMLTQFKDKRAVLEQVMEMIGEDPGLERLGPDFTRPEDPAQLGISPERIAVYRSLCLKAGIPHGFSHYGNTIEFIVHTRGLAIGGSGKGFAYREGADPNATIVDGDLDGAAAVLVDKDVLLQRKIDGNWWLQLDMR